MKNKYFLKCDGNINEVEYMLYVRAKRYCDKQKKAYKEHITTKFVGEDKFEERFVIIGNCELLDLFCYSLNY